MLDSLLTALADELVPDAACATLATASEGDGVIVDFFLSSREDRVRKKKERDRN